MTIKTGKDLKVALIRLDMTQAQLAQALGLTVKTINTLCNSDTIKPVYALAIECLLIKNQWGK